MCICLSQAIRDARERRLALASFTSDLQVFQELDAIAGSPGSTTYDRTTILEFLRSKEWVIETLSEVEDVSAGGGQESTCAAQESVPSAPPVSARPKPKMHVIFKSWSSEESGQPRASVTSSPTTRDARKLIYINREKLSSIQLIKHSSTCSRKNVSKQIVGKLSKIVI